MGVICEVEEYGVGAAGLAVEGSLGIDSLHSGFFQAVDQVGQEQRLVRGGRQAPVDIGLVWNGQKDESGELTTERNQFVDEGEEQWSNGEERDVPEGFSLLD